MSTTVIASRHGPLLALFPVASPATDVAQVQQVLARHGLTLASSSDLARTNEFIAAQGLARSGRQPSPTTCVPSA